MLVIQADYLVDSHIHFPIENTCILYHFTECQRASIAIHNFYSTLCNKRKPLNYSTQFHPNKCCEATMARVIHC